MADLILTSGALLDYAREMHIGRANPDRYLALQIAYSLAVMRETAIATATRNEMPSMLGPTSGLPPMPILPINGNDTVSHLPELSQEERVGAPIEPGKPDSSKKGRWRR